MKNTLRTLMTGQLYVVAKGWYVFFFNRRKKVFFYSSMKMFILIPIIIFSCDVMFELLMKKAKMTLARYLMSKELSGPFERFVDKG